jgi:hypothetical protein
MTSVNGIGYGHKRLIQNIVNTHWKTNAEKKVYNYEELIFVLDALLRDEGKPYMEGRYSLQHGYNNFKMFVAHLMYRNIANFDSMVLLTGEKGTGKSSAAIMLAREWCKMLGIKFNPARHIAYNNSDVSTKIDLLNKFEPIIADESIRFASSEDWARKENKELKKKLGQVRTKHLLYILCFPLKIYKVEKTYLENYVNYWIDIIFRGVGIIYVKDKNPNKDPWRVADFKMVGSYTEFSNLNKVKEQVKKHPNFWQVIKFPRPPEWLYNKYLKVREANVYDDANVLANVTKQDIYNALLILSLRDIMLHDSTLTMNRILLHIKNEFDITLTKSQLQMCIDDAKQLVTKVKEQFLNPNEMAVAKENVLPVEEEELSNNEYIESDTKQVTLDNDII